MLRNQSGQSKVLDRTLSACGHFGPPPKDLSPTGALEELRGANVYEDPESSLASLDLGLLSLPDPGSQPKPLVRSLVTKVVK